ncbi:MAG: hypothetical protein OXI81_07360 [Paracoccaceae bacterium]|nr:hypothetical protein [Paracoccaceae bacterium]
MKTKTTTMLTAIALAAAIGGTALAGASFAATATVAAWTSSTRGSSR